MRIGVFDSGIGGLSIANAIRTSLPKEDIVYANDREHVPYGTKSKAELLALVKPILQQLVDDGCRIIVIACNTVTTNLIDELRPMFSVPLIGIEPMVKPAVRQTRTGVIGVCATPATLKSQRYGWLKTTYASNVKVLEPDCESWAQMIENKAINRKVIKQTVDGLLNQQADVIVLGCTHYHWIEEIIKRLVDGRAIVIQPEEALIARLRRVIAEQPASL